MTRLELLLIKSRENVVAQCQARPINLSRVPINRQYFVKMKLWPQRLIHKVDVLKLQGQRVYLKNAGNTFHGHLTRVDLMKMGQSGMVIQKWKILLECHQLMPNSKIFKEYSNAVTSKKKSALARASPFLRPAQNSLVIHALKVSCRLTKHFSSLDFI